MFSTKLIFREKNGDLCGSGTKTLAVIENYIWILQHGYLLFYKES